MSVCQASAVELPKTEPSRTLEQVLVAYSHSADSVKVAVIQPLHGV